MPGSRRIDDPLNFLNALTKRVSTLERVQRPASFIGAQISKNADQTITTGIGSFTTVTFAHVDLDTDDFSDTINDRFVIPEDLDGYYELYAKIEWEFGTGQMIARGRINGSSFTETHSGSAAVITTTHWLGPITHYMAQGDYFDLIVSHNQGSNRAVVGSGDDFDTYFGLRFLGR